jgi:hypothetical protein
MKPTNSSHLVDAIDDVRMWFGYLSEQEDTRSQVHAPINNTQQQEPQTCHDGSLVPELVRATMVLNLPKCVQ